MSWTIDNWEDALTRACNDIFGDTGGCPLDKGECMFPTLLFSNDCDTPFQVLRCWKHYYLTRGE